MISKTKWVFAYSVTVFFGKGEGIRVSPRSEQSTTTPDEEQEHSDGHSLVPVPALTNDMTPDSPGRTTHKHIKMALIFILPEDLIIVVIFESWSSI